MTRRDPWENLSTPEDPEINIQPKTENPHVLEEQAEEEINIDEYINEYLTNEFSEEEVTELELIYAAFETSRELLEQYENGKGYLMAEIGPEGANAIAVGDQEDFRVDKRYDPEEIEGKWSPLEIMDRNGFTQKLGHSVIDYSVEDLSELDLEELENRWRIDFDDMESNNYRIVVSPGLESEYGDRLREMILEDYSKT